MYLIRMVGVSRAYLEAFVTDVLLPAAVQTLIEIGIRFGNSSIVHGLPNLTFLFSRIYFLFSQHDSLVHSS